MLSGYVSPIKMMLHCDWLVFHETNDNAVLL